MKTLSIQQPWASLILGIAPKITWGNFVQPKPVENRTWDTKHRGDFLIHAGKKFDRGALEYLYEPDQGIDVPWKNRHENFTTGAVLGIVTLVDIVQDSSSDWAMDDCFHWVLENPRPFTKSFPYKGQLGLFNVPMTLHKLNEAVGVGRA